MNQILVTEKIYVTPELKKKKVFFKIEFILSVFLLCIVSIYAIYASYDRNKSEAVSKDILSDIEFIEEQKKESIMIALNDSFDEFVVIEEEETETEEQTIESLPSDVIDGLRYSTLGVIEIPSLDINYAIIEPENEEDIDKALKISPCKFWGANPNEVGNLCIAGHNYRNSKFFSKVPKMEIGDIIYITDIYKKKIAYEVYDKYIVEPDDTRCTSQLTDGKKEITLITCTNDNKKRVIIKATEI